MTDVSRAHLPEFPAAGYRTWRWACLRSAGLPAAAWDELAPGGDATDPAAHDQLDGYWEQLADRVRKLDPERFATALRWQSPGVYRHAWVPVVEGRHRPDTSRGRRSLRGLAAYAARYALKNDSIGFFGPVGWAYLDDAAPATTVVPGPRLVARGAARLEAWAVQALADRWVTRTDLRGDLCPVVAPHARLDGVRLRMPFGASVELTPQQASLLERCDGSTPARTLIVGACAGAAEALADLDRRNWAIWRYVVTATEDPQRDLREFLESAGAGAARDVALAELGAIERVLAALPAGPASPHAVDDLLAAATATVDELVGDAAQGAADRRHGRTAVYLDATRDVDVTLGADALRSLGPPLAVVLASVGWLLGRVAATLEAELASIFDDLPADSSGAVELIDVWAAGANLWFRPDTDLFAAATAELQDRWASVVPYAGADGPAVHVDPAEAAARAAEAFAGETGWSIWPYCCPDVLVADGGDEDPRYVLGEVHAALNSVDAGALVATHPDAAELQQAWQADHGELDPVRLRGNPVAASHRLLPVLGRGAAVELAASPSIVGGPGGAQVEPLTGFVVRREEGRLVATHRRGRVPARRLLALLADPLAASAVNTFRPIRPGRQRPRVVMGDLVLSRRSWWLGLDDVAPIAAATTTGDRLRAARRVAADLDMPRRVFVAAPGHKPALLDFASPATVDAAARLLAGAKGDVRVSEMLPEPAQAWLVDAGGRRYTSELRLVVHRPAPGAR